MSPADIVRSTTAAINAIGIIPTVVLVVVGYFVSLGISRLWLSPLAAVPGSRLTIMSSWYESYCEIVRGGQFTMQIYDWHKRYGPIIRINPREIHINDPDFYDTIYATTAPRDKLKAFQYRLNTPHAAFSTADHHLHRVRRVALNPFFSRRRVLDFQPRLHRHVERLCARLARDFRGQRRVLVLDHMLACATTDVVLDYAFDMPAHLVDSPDFQNPFTSAIRDMQLAIHWTTAFPWLITLGNCLPDRWVKFLFPVTRSVLDFRETLSQLLRESHERVSKPRVTQQADRSQPIVFDELLRSSLPPAQLTPGRLQDEALSIVGAGLETTRFAATVACFHILAQPALYARLRRELATVVSLDGPLPALSALEELPLLCACVEEALRLSYGGPSRSPRISPTPLHYGKYVIPAGTAISCETYSLHHNERLYPNSWEFRPERWLDGEEHHGTSDAPATAAAAAATTAKKKKLSRHMVAFGRGSRMCLGMPLAYAELYLLLATLLRRFEFELFETDRRAVDCARTALGPLPAQGTMGVRVLVCGDEDERRR